MAGDSPDDAPQPAWDEVLARVKDHLAYAHTIGVREIPVRPQQTVSLPLTPAVPARASQPSADADPAAALERLRRDTIGDCRRCKLAPTRTHIVFGVGDPRAELMFVGEAPGGDEDEQGIPFIGRAGQLLTKIIEAMGLTRDRVYIANIIKCRPPGNRNPQPDEIESCEPFLIAQLDAIRPKVICALGTFAAQTLLKTKDPISRLRGRWHAYQDIPLMPTFHPAYLLRNPAEKKTVWGDVQTVMERLGIPPPAAVKGR